MFYLICASINGWVNNRKAGDLRRHRAHYDVIVMIWRGKDAMSLPKPNVCRQSFRCIQSVSAKHASSNLGIMMTSSNGNIFRVTGHLCVELTGHFPSQRPVMRSLDVFFGLRLNRHLSQQWRRWWFETPSHPLWRHFTDVNALTRNGRHNTNNILMRMLYRSSLLHIDSNFTEACF